VYYSIQWCGSYVYFLPTFLYIVALKQAILVLYSCPLHCFNNKITPANWNIHVITLHYKWKLFKKLGKIGSKCTLTHFIKWSVTYNPLTWPWFYAWKVSKSQICCNPISLISATSQSLFLSAAIANKYSGPGRKLRKPCCHTTREFDVQCTAARVKISSVSGKRTFAGQQTRFESFDRYLAVRHPWNIQSFPPVNASTVVWSLRRVWHIACMVESRARWKGGTRDHDSRYRACLGPRKVTC